MEGKLSKVIGDTMSVLDARVETVRTKESTIGNYFSDCMRFYFQCDIALINGGSIRSDDTYGPGKITLKGINFPYLFSYLFSKRKIY